MKMRLDTLVKEAKSTARASWNLRAREAFHRGAGRAHRFTVESKPWTPTTLLMEDGTVTAADPQRLLADLGSKWAAIWKAIPKDEVNDRGGCIPRGAAMWQV